MKLDTRKQTLLSGIIREYSKTAEPVASNAMGRGLRVSAATIRNEMVALEKEGFLYQPHTSAGRVPTEKGYKYYVENCLCLADVEQEITNLQQIFLSDDEDEAKMKTLARKLSEGLSEGVFIGFDSHSTYYTGLSRLFSKPEFESVDFVRYVSDIIDNLDQVVERLFATAENGVQVYIGAENPFGNQCGTVLLKKEHLPMLGILGTMRMDYDHAVGLMTGLERLMKNK